MSGVDNVVNNRYDTTGMGMGEVGGDDAVGHAPHAQERRKSEWVLIQTAKAQKGGIFKERGRW